MFPLNKLNAPFSALATCTSVYSRCGDLFGASRTSTWFYREAVGFHSCSVYVSWAGIRICISGRASIIFVAFVKAFFSVQNKFSTSSGGGQNNWRDLISSLNQIIIYWFIDWCSANSDHLHRPRSKKRHHLWQIFKMFSAQQLQKFTSKKRISQTTFDEAVRENIDEFDMEVRF